MSISRTQVDPQPRSNKGVEPTPKNGAAHAERSAFMSMTARGAWCLSLFFLVSGPVITQAEPSPMPKRLIAYIGGFAARSYCVELRQGILTYTASDQMGNETRTKIEPTAEQWQEFRQALDDLNVWKWRPRYLNELTVDRTRWSLDIGYEDRELASNGENSYPDTTGEPNSAPVPTEAFRHYLSAVKKLTGGRDFE